MSAVVVMLHGFGLSRRFAPHNDIKWEFRTLRDARGCRFARLRNDIYKSMVLYYIIYIDYVGEKWGKKEL